MREFYLSSHGPLRTFVELNHNAMAPIYLQHTLAARDGIWFDMQNTVNLFDEFDAI